MKFLNKILIVFLVSGIAFTSCENLDLDKRQDPNNPSPENASLNDLYNQIQLAFRNVYTSSQFDPGAHARMYTNVAFTYQAASPPTTFNGLWGNAYEVLFPDVQALEGLAGENDFGIHIGSAKIMQAYTMLVLVDLFGDVPYSQALQGTDVISPSVDPGADVYAEAIALLDEAIAILGGTAGPRPAVDNFYGGDANKWIAAANTIKMKAALNTGDAAAFNAAVNAGVIDDASEDLAFNYGTQRANPNSRHPFYNNHYEIGDGDYLSNYFMWLLRADKENLAGNTIVDPRLRYYFFRKVDDSFNQDQTTFSCHFSTLPTSPDSKPNQLASWDAIDPDLPYCVAHPDGWTGRDHLNGEGIPPDGPIRTSYGLYPFGGDFDADDFTDTRQTGTTGGLGGGILPIFLSSYTDFMRAEAALRIGAAGDARALLESGISKSLDKVEGFESLVSAKMGSSVTLRDGSEGTIKELYGMSASSKQGYIDDVLALYDAADNNGKLDIVIKEFLIAAWGNGLEAFNMYRRTALPSNMMPALEPPGAYPQSFFYPNNSVNRNSSISQKGDLNVPVFWQDAGVAAQLY